MEQKTREDYLRALYEIYERLDDKKSGIKSVELAKKLGVSKPTASEVLKKLDEGGYLSAEPYSPIFLTHKGLREGKRLIHAHRVIEVFLAKVLKYSPRKVENETHKLEHAFSKESVEKLDEFLEHPTTCPHGEKIHESLNQLKIGETALICEIAGGQGAKQRLTDMGLTIGTKIKVKTCAPFGGPVCIEVKGSQLAIGHGLARKVLVDRGEK